MANIISNNGRLQKLKKEFEEFKEDIKISLNYNGMSKLPPFHRNIDTEVVNENQIFFLYLSRDVPVDIINEEKASWWVFVSEGIAIKTDIPTRTLQKGNNELGKASYRTPAKYYHVNDIKVPIYIKFFYESVKKKWKKSLILIGEGLPHDFGIDIYHRFNLRKEKEIVLSHLAEATIQYYDKSVKNKLNGIIGNKNKPFKKALDEIFCLSGERIEVNYSFCIVCEKFLKVKNKCICPRPSDKDNWNCYNKIIYYLEHRLGIKEKEEKKQKLNYLNLELQSLLQRYPLYGLEEFKKKNEILYLRKKRESLQRKSEGR